MSIVDKVIAAVTPPESQEDRAEARAKAQAAAVQGSWLQMVLTHHLAIESAFAEVKQARDAASRRTGEHRLAAVLNAHSIAEELVLYPAMALHDEKGHSVKAYTEHAATKVQMAALETLEPMSEDYLDKLEHIQGAVLHHLYQEEGDWLLDLNAVTDAALHQRLAQRYTEEFERYQGGAEESAPLGRGGSGVGVEWPQATSAVSAP